MLYCLEWTDSQWIASNTLKIASKDISQLFKLFLNFAIDQVSGERVSVLFV